MIEFIIRHISMSNSNSKLRRRNMTFMRLSLSPSKGWCSVDKLTFTAICISCTRFLLEISFRRKHWRCLTKIEILVSLRSHSCMLCLLLTFHHTITNLRHMIMLGSCLDWIDSLNEPSYSKMITLSIFFYCQSVFQESEYLRVSLS